MQAYGDFCVRLFACGVQYANSNSSRAWVADDVWLRGHGPSQFGSDQIFGQLVWLRHDRLVDVINCKWVKWSRLRQQCNADFKALATTFMVIVAREDSPKWYISDW